MTGGARRSQDEFIYMVPKESARLGAADEQLIQVDRDHSDLAKVISPTDEPYKTYINALKSFLDSDIPHVGVKRVGTREFDNLRYL